jgi:hypothetical protein
MKKLVITVEDGVDEVIIVGRLVTGGEVKYASGL